MAKQIFQNKYKRATKITLYTVIVLFLFNIFINTYIKEQRYIVCMK